MGESFKKEKYLGGIGALLSLPVWFESLTFLTYLIGLFFQIFAIHSLSKKILSKKVFWFYLLSIFLKFSVIVLGLVSLYFLLGQSLFVYTLTYGFSFEFVSPEKKYYFLALGLILWLFLFLGCLFYYKAFKEISQKTGINYFSKGAKISIFAGIFYFTILGGVFLDVLAQCFVMLGYFLLPES